MKLRELSRFSAAAYHFSFSLLLAVLIFSLFRLLWYPQATFALSGADTLFLILISVDVVIGPLLTLIVFNPSKRELPRDLAVIAILQFVALAYGLNVIYQSRPVFLVAAVDRFVLVSANELLPERLAEARSPEFGELSLTGPRVVGAIGPRDSQERLNLIFSTSSGGADIELLPRYYVRFSDVAAELRQRASTLAQLENQRPAAAASIREHVRKLGRSESELLFLPLQARRGFGAVMMEQETLAIVGSLAVDIIE